MIYLVFVLFTLIVLLFGLYQFQYFMIFTPTYIQERRLCNQCQALEIVTEDNIVLEGAVYEPKNVQATLLFFAGRSHDSIALIQRLSILYPHTRIITFNYRSYGRNKGSITEENMFADGVYIANIVQKNYGDFYILGFSIGSSIASYVASKTVTKGVFLIGAFDSIPLIAKKKFGFALPAFFNRYKFPTVEFVKKIEAPTYLFVSEHDEITYIENSRNLAKNIKNLALYKEYENRTHQEVLWDEDVIGIINSAISSA